MRLYIQSVVVDVVAVVCRLCAVSQSRVFAILASLRSKKAKSISDLWHTVNCFFSSPKPLPKKSQWLLSLSSWLKYGRADCELIRGWRSSTFCHFVHHVTWVAVSCCAPKLLLLQLFYHNWPHSTILATKKLTVYMPKYSFHCCCYSVFYSILSWKHGYLMARFTWLVVILYRTSGLDLNKCSFLTEVFIFGDHCTLRCNV